MSDTKIEKLIELHQRYKSIARPTGHDSMQTEIIEQLLYIVQDVIFEIRNKETKIDNGNE